MKIAFERDEIVRIENDAGAYLGYRIKIKLRLKKQHADLFVSSMNSAFELSLDYDDDSIITGSFIWSHNEYGYTYLESTGPVNYVYLGKKDNSKTLRRISKIQNQIDKLKVELEG